MLILSGSTIGEIANTLKIFTWNHGISLNIEIGDYGKFYEQAVFDEAGVPNAGFDFIYVHISNRNLLYWPELNDSALAVQEKLDKEFARIEQAVDSLRRKYNGAVIINNFESLACRLQGNRDRYEDTGHLHYIDRLNQMLYQMAKERSDVYINDIHYLSSMFGLSAWSNPTYWYRYKYALCLEAIPYLCHNLSNIVKAICGLNKKCIALDLDNTLWGGVIGDDGLNGLELGHETPQGEAFLEFQQYLKRLSMLGIPLSVATKNEPEVALAGFGHPEMLLQRGDFIEFVASWNHKSESLKEIAQKLNISTDAIVFVDDNPSEREWIRSVLQATGVPEMVAPEQYILNLDQQGFFETVQKSGEDALRMNYYKQNQQREMQQQVFENYDDYLNSLEMVWKFEPFQAVSLERLAQLVNKTNQFNLTTNRMTYSKIAAIMEDENYLTIQGRLSDKFGDNGLVTAFIGKISDGQLTVLLWVMSCRVFKRNLEIRLFEYLQNQCRERGIHTICGEYIPTAKNKIVSELYPSLGFHKDGETAEGSTRWSMTL